MDVTYHVSSPLTSGPGVKARQQILDGGNVFGKDFLRGAVDGQFGEETGRACIRAKYWLGYPDKELKPTFGSSLEDYLMGRAQPTKEMIARTAARQKKAAETPLREKALVEAEKHLGYKETPAGSNRTSFGKWYGADGNPWCAMFVTYCYVAKGSKAFARGSRYAYVPYIVADARAGRNGLSVTREPKPGDVVCFDWDGGVADHVGLFRAGSPASFKTIEGNTGIGNDSNGGEVMHRDRVGSTVECFVRVGR